MEAYKISHCTATWNNKDGWDCVCEHKHPTLCALVVNIEPCTECDGSGKLYYVCDQGHYGTEVECPHCQGTEVECPHCQGTGEIVI